MEEWEASKSRAKHHHHHGNTFTFFWAHLYNIYITLYKVYNIWYIYIYNTQYWLLPMVYPSVHHSRLKPRGTSRRCRRGCAASSSSIARGIRSWTPWRNIRRRAHAPIGRSDEGSLCGEEHGLKQQWGWSYSPKKPLKFGIHLSSFIHLLWGRGLSMFDIV